jgi:hypothetical protein
MLEGIFVAFSLDKNDKKEFSGEFHSDLESISLKKFSFLCVYILTYHLKISMCDCFLTYPRSPNSPKNTYSGAYIYSGGD